jgi:hypothetical protein
MKGDNKMASAAKALVRDHIERRRSERFPMRVTLLVCGRSEKGSFREETVTLSINSHGALMALSANVAIGQRLVLMNPQTWDEVEVRVSRLAALHDQRTQVAVEFAQPAPQFWATGAPPIRTYSHRDTVRSRLPEA